LFFFSKKKEKGVVAGGSAPHPAPFGVARCSQATPKPAIGVDMTYKQNLSNILTEFDCKN
jgi:hypothetical protein